MATEVASLVTRLTADASGLQKGLRDADKEVGNFASKASKSVGDLGKKMAGLGVATAPLTAALGLSVKAAIDWESQFAGVVKTVDATDKELGILEDTLRDMATGDSPVAALEGGQATLAGIAEAAGQLGVEIDAIDEFTETVAMLGTATNLTGEEAATFAARFANVTGLNIAEDIDNLGDTIVTLGNNLATTESEIATFGQRLSPLATFGWDPQDILAYGGALSSLGVSAELGGTNVLKTISDMTVAVAEGGDELTGFAGVAGMTADEFAKLNKNDPEGSFNAFIKGLAGLSADEQILALQGLNITGTEQISVLQRLAAGYDTLDESLDLANEGWDENGALAKEAAARAKTLQGRLNKLGNTTTELQISVGEHLTPAVGDFVDGITPAVKGVSDWIQENPFLAGTVIRVAGAISAAGAAMIGIGGAIAILSPAVGGLAVAFGLLTSPIALAVAGVAALIHFGPELATMAGNIAGSIGAALSGIQIGGTTVGAIAASIGEAINGIQIGSTTLGGLTSAVSGAISNALNGIVIDVSSLTALPGKIMDAIGAALGGTPGRDGADALSEWYANTYGGTVTFPADMFTPLAADIGALISDALDGVVIDTSSLTTLPTTIGAAIRGSFTGGIDLTGVSTWADTNLNRVLDTVVSVAGIVFGGPIGLAIGAAKLISSAIESDFLGIGTFLSESGIGAAVEGAFNDLKATIDGIIASIFGGGGEQAVSMSDHVRSMVDTGGGAGVLGKFGDDLKKGVDVIKGVVESVGPGITEGIEALGAGVGRFIAGITGAETEGLYDAIRPVLGVIGGLVSAGITLAGLGIGTALETFGNVLGPLGEGIGSLITTVSRLGEGDIGGALEALGGGIKKFGDAALAIPGTIANNVLSAIEDLTGVELPDFPMTIDAWATEVERVFSDLGRRITVGFEGVIRDINTKFAELRVTGLQLGVLAGTNTEEEARAALHELASYYSVDAVSAALETQIGSGVIDLSQSYDVQLPGGAPFTGQLLGALQQIDPSILGEEMRWQLEDAFAVAIGSGDFATAGQILSVAPRLELDIDEEAARVGIAAQLKTAIETGDQSLYFAALQMATDIGLNAVEIQQEVTAQVTAAAESATPSATVAVNVNAAVANLGEIVAGITGQIQSALAGTPLGQAADAVGNAIKIVTGTVPSYAVGTSYVEHDQLAYLHRGEAVLTADENRDRMRGGRAGGNTTYVINQPLGNGYQIVDQLRRVENNGPRGR